jgi:hypothetical protein
VEAAAATPGKSPLEEPPADIGVLVSERGEFRHRAPTAAPPAALRGATSAGFGLLGVVADAPLGITHSLCAAASAIGFDPRTKGHSLPLPLVSSQYPTPPRPRGCRCPAGARCARHPRAGAQGHPPAAPP